MVERTESARSRNAGGVMPLSELVELELECVSSAMVGDYERRVENRMLVGGGWVLAQEYIPGWRWWVVVQGAAAAATTTSAASRAKQSERAEGKERLQPAESHTFWRRSRRLGRLAVLHGERRVEFESKHTASQAGQAGRGGRCDR